MLHFYPLCFNPWLLCSKGQTTVIQSYVLKQDLQSNLFGSTLESGVVVHSTEDISIGAVLDVLEQRVLLALTIPQVCGLEKLRERDHRSRSGAAVGRQLKHGDTVINNKTLDQ